MTLAGSSTRSLSKFFRHRTNFKIAKILHQNELPMSCGKIASEYSPQPPLASIALTLVEAERFGVVRVIDSKSTNGKSLKLYQLTEAGKEAFCEQNRRLPSTI